jgi:hypothetical protein
MRGADSVLETSRRIASVTGYSDLVRALVESRETQDHSPQRMDSDERHR